MVPGERCAEIESEWVDGWAAVGRGHVEAVGIEVVGNAQRQEGWVGEANEKLGLRVVSR